MVVTHVLHFSSIGIENTIVMRLDIVGKDVMQLLGRLVAVSGACLLSHLDTSVWHECTLEGLVCLQTYHRLKVFHTLVDISRPVSVNAGDYLCLHIQHATLGPFLSLKFLQTSPKLLGSLSRTSEERLVAIKGSVVVLNKISDINFILPKGLLKSLPFCSHKCD